MSHRLNNSPSPRAVIGTPWFIRKAVYAVVTIIGLVAVVMGWADPGQVDGWADQLSTVLAQLGPLAAIIGGLVAGVHTGPASDKSPAEEIAGNLPAAPAPTPVHDGFTAYPDEVHRAG